MAEPALPRVLVIDDEPDMARAIRILLHKKFGAVVEVAGSAGEARECLERGCDLVTLDYQMDDCDGLTILKEIKRGSEELPVIMVTGHGDEAIAAEAFRNGASGYVVKDQRLPELLADAVNKAFMESRLKQAERELRDLVETANSIILKVDTGGNLTYINKYGQEFFGYSEGELVGKNVLETIVPEYESTGRDLSAMVRSLLADPDSHQPNINENIKKAGTRVWISWTNRALRDINGNVTGNLAVGNDITARVAAELALVDRVEEYRKLADMVDSVSVAIFAADPDSRITFWSKGAERMYGYSADEALGRTGLELIGSDCIPEHAPEESVGMAGTGASSLFEAVHRRKDGSRLTVERRAWPLRNASGESEGYVGLHIDRSGDGAC